MAGYFLYTYDNDVFTQLTTSPTKAQADALAGFLLEEIEYELEDAEEEGDDISMWPLELEALSTLVARRLAMPDWYSDLTMANADIWDRVLYGLQDEPGETIGIDFQCTDYESIYWDCAEIAAAQGASMMAEPAFGSSGFRYFGKPTSEYGNYPMYSVYVPAQSRELLKQLESVQPHFETLPGNEDSPREQFFEGLLPAVQDAATQGRLLWVQTDT